MVKHVTLTQRQEGRVVNDLMRRLKEAGSTGLDLSPGDPLCMEAYERIKKLEEELDYIPPNVRKKYREIKAVIDCGGSL